MASEPPLTEEDIGRVSAVVHEAMRAFQRAHGQDAAPPWSRAPAWMKTSTREAVLWRLDNPRARASAQHDQWMAQKAADGWVYGKVKSGTAKTHPMMIPYVDLPEVERRKDALVVAVIQALTSPMD